MHALIQAREDLERLVTTVPPDHVWRRPGGRRLDRLSRAARRGALDRLLTYARGDALSDAQRAALKAEGEPGDPPAPLAAVVAADVGRIIEAAMDQLRATPRDSLLDERKVGRAGLPATVLGLLFTPPSTTRHVGQAITTALIQHY